MWNRDLKVFTLVYAYSWKQRHVDYDDNFSHWGKPTRVQEVAVIVAPSEIYVRAWLNHKFNYDKEALPELVSITFTELTAFINPNHP